MGIWSRLGKGMLAVAAAATVFAGAAFAAEKKELTVYTALENEQINKYLASFREKYPDIEIKIVRDSTGIVTAKLLAEGEKTPADVVWGTAASSLLVLEDRGMIEPYAPKGLERVEPMLKDTANPPAWVGIDAWETAIIYNTAEAKAKGLPEIKSYKDLLRPEFKGQIIMSNPNSSGTGFLAVTGLIHLMGEEEAFKYMDQLHNNIAMYTHSGSAPAKKAAAGEFAVGISYGYAGMNQKKKGAPVEVIFPEEGSGWDSYKESQHQARGEALPRLGDFRRGHQRAEGRLRDNGGQGARGNPRGLRQRPAFAARQEQRPEMVGAQPRPHPQGVGGPLRRQDGGQLIPPAFREKC